MSVPPAADNAWLEPSQAALTSYRGVRRATATSVFDVKLLESHVHYALWPSWDTDSAAL